MRHSEFWGLVSEVLGPRGESLSRDYVLSQFAGRTASQALEAGFAPKEVWFALCDAADVPEELRWGQPLRKRK